MQDVPSDLGQRIVEAAKLAVQLHLESSQSSEEVFGGAETTQSNKPVFDGVEIVIGGANRSDGVGLDHNARIAFIRAALGPRRLPRSEAA